MAGMPLDCRTTLSTPVAMLNRRGGGGRYYSIGVLLLALLLSHSLSVSLFCLILSLVQSTLHSLPFGEFLGQVTRNYYLLLEPGEAPLPSPRLSRSLNPDPLALPSHIRNRHTPSIIFGLGYPSLLLPHPIGPGSWARRIKRSSSPSKKTRMIASTHH